jgi:hypothetical protein
MVGGVVAVVGWWSGAAAALIVSLPIIGALAAGWATRRGLIVASVLLVFGMTQVHATSAGVSWADLVLLSGIVATGLVVGRQVESRIPQRSALETAEGIWMCVTVEAGSPPELGGIPNTVPVPPLDDPERRSLYRRKNRRRELAGARD